jgi:hypothetical protein
MAPSIEAYNSRVPELSWDKLSKECTYPSYNADLELYAELTNFLFTLLDNNTVDKFYFIDSHDTIIDFLDENKEYCIINIDHHHDIGYDPPDAKEKSPLNCGNWVQFVPNLKHYHWVRNINSIMPPDYITINNMTEGLISSFNYAQVKNPNKIFICLSTPWIPPMYRSLYFLWMDIYNKTFNVHAELEETKQN